MTDEQRAERRHARDEKDRLLEEHRAQRLVRQRERQHAAMMEGAVGDAPPSPGERGLAAEDRAVAALRAEGYSIIERNWRANIGELDVVARDGGVLVFVEVRSREDDLHGHAAEMVTAQKRRKVTTVARVYLQLEQPRFERCRFDVVAVTGDQVDIIKDAWRT